MAIAFIEKSTAEMQVEVRETKPETKPAGVETKPSTPTRSKGGRPKTTGEPWVAAGMSRAGWYRLRKKGTPT